MGLGLNIDSGSAENGEITPFIKYDARAGRLFRNDRIQGPDGSYTSAPADITRTFKAVVDMENIEVGWLLFGAGSAPQMTLVPLGAPLPPKPATAQGAPAFKQGCRLVMKLAKSCGDDVRELTGNSAAFLRGINKLHDAYEAGEKENPGKLPVVALKDALPITSGSGDKKSTNYEPVFEIVSWVNRPADLTPRPRSATPASAETINTPRTAPPATGSQQVSAPAPATSRTPEPAMAMADDEDFG